MGPMRLQVNVETRRIYDEEIQDVDSNLATAIRTVVILIFACLIA